LDRVKSGVPGFDDLVDGGFPKGFAVLLSGAPGTGKSIFGLHFLKEGIKNGESCAYVTYSQSPKDILDQASMFGWDLQMVEFLEMKPEDFDNMLSGKSYNRIVLDSLSSVAVMTRDSLGRFIKSIKDVGCTALLISELPIDSQWLSRDTISEFLCDGVVILKSVEAAGDVKNLLKVEKMRSTKIDQKSYIYSIAENGFGVKTYKVK
jgi:KaiC/GvpD/RAD55 family RecA-like ATPase